MKRLTRRLLRPAFYFACISIAVLSLAPGTALPSASIGDKAEHVIAYTALALLGALSYERRVLRVGLGLIAFGLAIEALQALSPGRSPDAIDVLADVIGVSLGSAAAFALRRAASNAIDKVPDAATGCAPCVSRRDAIAASAAPAAQHPSPDARARCLSN